MNYLRTKKTLKRKLIKHWLLIKGDVNNPNVKHNQSVMQNIIEYKEARKKDLENKTVNNKSIIYEEKTVILNEKFIKKTYNLTKKQKEFKIIFPNKNERDENEFLFFTKFIEEKINFQMKAAKVLKIKQEADTDNLNSYCCRY